MDIIFDLDGTLIDASERLYRLFSDIIQCSKLSKEDYWRIKRNKVDHKTMLKNLFPEESFVEFNASWMLQIEVKKYLDMDIIYSGTEHILEKISKKNALYLLTSRQSKENLLYELSRLKLLTYFDEIWATETRFTKEEILRKYYAEKQRDNKVIFVSDMGTDIVLGNYFGYITVAITHGFMNRERLLEHAPNYIIDDLSQLEAIIGAVGN